MEITRVARLPFTQVHRVRTYRNSLLVSDRFSTFVVTEFKLENNSLQKIRVIDIPLSGFLVCDNLEVKRPVILVYGGSRDKIFIYDYLTLHTIAEGTNTSDEYILWKDHYILDDSLRLLTLVPTDDGKQFTIEFVPTTTFTKTPHSKIFTFGNTLAISRSGKMEFFAWNDKTLYFQHLAFSFNSKINVKDITHIIQLSDRIAVQCHSSGSWISLVGLDGTCYHSTVIIDANTIMVNWNNLLTAITTSSHAKPTLKFFSNEGRLIQEIPIEGALQCHIWNHHLVLGCAESMIIMKSKTYVGVANCEVGFWKTERLLWLAWMKNKDDSLIGKLPKELLIHIISIFRRLPIKQA